MTAWEAHERFLVKNEDDQVIGHVDELSSGWFLAWIYRHTDDSTTAQVLGYPRPILERAERAICAHYDDFGLPGDIEEETW